jgi:nucleotide-binding universal stress UspA family protein
LKLHFPVRRWVALAGGAAVLHIPAAAEGFMSGAKRRSFEAGHRPKFMVVVDGTPESMRAVHFAARRAARTGASLVMLGVVTMEETFEFLGVGDAMREEAEDEVTRLLASATDHAKEAASVQPEQVVKEGEKADCIRELIEEDQDISFLVLAASTDSAGPGPLVSGIASSSGGFSVPIVIVPGDLSDEEIDALAG